MIIDYVQGATNQFNLSVFPIWNWLTGPSTPIVTIKRLKVANISLVDKNKVGTITLVDKYKIGKIELVS